MKRTKLVLGTTVAAMFLLFSGTAAHAQYDPPASTTVPGGDIPQVTVVRGESVDVAGTDCAPGSEVTITLDDGTVLGTATADDAGGFVQSITIPPSTSLGEHLITATCGEHQQFLRVDVLGESVEVVPVSGSALPRTGSSNTAPLVGIGAGALVLGAAFVYGSRRPRTA